MAKAQGAGGVGSYNADQKELSNINNVQGTNTHAVTKQQDGWWSNAAANTVYKSVEEQAAERERQANFRYTTGTAGTTDPNNPGGTNPTDTNGGGLPNTIGDGLPDTNGGGGGGGGGSVGSSRPSYTAAILPSATSQADYINAMYNANEQKRRAALEAQYTANIGSLDRQAATIPGQYDAAANQAAAQAAVNRANFNEMAAANGLNTGAAGQAALAQNNALLGAVSEIRRNQANALNDVEAQRVSLQQQYQAAIKEAIANNEADRAAALYNEAKRVDESLVSTAVNQATENYRAWQAMYG